jgi:hypothetical protein
LVLHAMILHAMLFDEGFFFFWQQKNIVIVNISFTINKKITIN